MLSTEDAPKSDIKNIIFKGHYLSRMAGASSHSEFTKLADNWENLLSKDSKDMDKSDKTVITSLLSIMRSYEDMKAFRSMGFHNAQNFWPTLSTMTNLVYNPNSRKFSTTDDYGFTSCMVRKERNQPKENSDQV